MEILIVDKIVITIKNSSHIKASLCKGLYSAGSFLRICLPPNLTFSLHYMAFYNTESGYSYFVFHFCSVIQWNYKIVCHNFELCRDLEKKSNKVFNANFLWKFLTMLFFLTKE